MRNVLDEVYGNEPVKLLRPMDFLSRLMFLQAVPQRSRSKYPAVLSAWDEAVIETGV